MRTDLWEPLPWWATPVPFYVLVVGSMAAVALMLPVFAGLAVVGRVRGRR